MAREDIGVLENLNQLPLGRPGDLPTHPNLLDR